MRCATYWRVLSRPSDALKNTCRALRQYSTVRSIRRGQMPCALVNERLQVVLGQSNCETIGTLWWWRLTSNGTYSSRSAYKLFFMGRSKVPSARELWSSGAPLKHKIHMWLTLKDRLWTADRLEERGLQHPAHCALCFFQFELWKEAKLCGSGSEEV
jgi:hypothetical protein